MTIQEQLAQSVRSAQFQTGPPPIDLFSSMFNLNTGLLGNTAGQFREMASLSNAAEVFWHYSSSTQPILKLAALKRRKFTAQGREDRIAKSLSAVNAPQPTELSAAEWKAILEEIEDED